MRSVGSSHFRHGLDPCLISTVLVVEVEFELGVSTIVVVGFKFGAVNVGERNSTKTEVYIDIYIDMNFYP